MYMLIRGRFGVGAGAALITVAAAIAIGAEFTMEITGPTLPALAPGFSQVISRRLAVPAASAALVPTEKPSRITRNIVAQRSEVFWW